MNNTRRKKIENLSEELTNLISTFETAKESCETEGTTCEDLSKQAYELDESDRFDPMMLHLTDFPLLYGMSGLSGTRAKLEELKMEEEDTRENMRDGTDMAEISDAAIESLGEAFDQIDDAYEQFESIKGYKDLDQDQNDTPAEFIGQIISDLNDAVDALDAARE